MEMLDILINPKNTENVCFLCYKHSDNTTGLHEDIEIHDELFSFNITLFNIMKTLFPSHDLQLLKSCEDCTELLIKIFTLLQRNYLKNEMLNVLVENINEEIDKKESDSERILKKYKLKVNLLTPESILNNARELMKSEDCKKCDMKFRSKVLLQKHVKITHKNANEAIICDICGKIFNKSATLKVHLSTHKEKKCPHCFKVLKSHSHFNVHLKNHNTAIKRKRRPKYHSCDNCDYKSINKSTLEAHINKIHLNIRPFICALCEKGFYKKSHLTQHFVTHEKIKDKTCEICGDTFVNEKTLVEHLRLHSRQKPFKCDVCGDEFINSGRRLEHMKRRHMEKAECCIFCSKKFSLKKDLNSHLKRVHGAENCILNPDNTPTVFQVVRVKNHTQ